MSGEPSPAAITPARITDELRRQPQARRFPRTLHKRGHIPCPPRREPVQASPPSPQHDTRHFNFQGFAPAHDRRRPVHLRLRFQCRQNHNQTFQHPQTVHPRPTQKARYISFTHPTQIGRRTDADLHHHPPFARTRTTKSPPRATTGRATIINAFYGYFQLTGLPNGSE